MNVSFNNSSPLRSESTQGNNLSNAYSKSILNDPWMELEEETHSYIQQFHEEGTTKPEFPLYNNLPIGYSQDRASCIRHIHENLGLMTAILQRMKNNPELFSISTNEELRRQHVVKKFQTLVTPFEKEYDQFSGVLTAPNDSLVSSRSTFGAPMPPLDDTNSLKEAREQHMPASKYNSPQLQFNVLSHTKKDVSDTVEEQQIDRLSAGIQRIRLQVDQIHEELDEQELVVENIMQDMTFLEIKLHHAIRTVNHLIDQSSDRAKWLIIIGLLLILFVLIFLVAK